MVSFVLIFNFNFVMIKGYTMCDFAFLKCIETCFMAQLPRLLQK